MGDPLRRSEPEDDGGVEADRAAGGAGRRPSRLGGFLVIAMAMALVVLIVLLHVTGTLGPGAH